MYALTMILTDGGLGSLVAVAIADAARRDGKYRLLPAIDPARGSLQRAAIERQAEVYGAEIAPDFLQAAEAGLGASQVLLAASQRAVEGGCASLVWPLTAWTQDGFDRAAIAADRALLVSRLVALDAPQHNQPAFRIETPLIDLTDAQVAELAVDMDVPVQLCWWWNQGEGSAESARWLPHLRHAGLAAAV